MTDRYVGEAVKALEYYVTLKTDELGGRCESPIERGLLASFIALQLLDRTFQVDGLRPDARLVTEYEAKVFIQHQIGEFRADFAINLTGHVKGKGRSCWIAVECDGHDFHERTKQQAARDKARDRAITTAGYRILRFTGAEIYRSSFACAADVHALVQKIIQEWEAE